MNIGYVVHSFHRHGGIERAAFEIACRSALLGDEITVYAATFGGEPAGSVKKIRVPAWRRTTSTLLATYPFFVRRRLASHAIIHDQAALIGRCDVLTLQSCHRAGMEARDADRGALRSGTNLGLADALRLRLERRALRPGSYRVIIAVSEGLKREVCARYPVPEEAVTVIPNGVDLREFHPVDDATRSDLRSRMGVGRDERVLLFVGNEFDRKGLAYVLDALRGFREEKVRLIVAGADEPAPYIRRSRELGVEGMVTFTGRTEELAPLYQASDIFVMPTLHESFLMAAVEAAACGTPILVTRVPGAEDYLADGENGFFITRSGEDVARRVRLLLGDDAMRKKMGDRASLRARDYSWDRVVRETHAVYDAVSREARR